MESVDTGTLILSLSRYITELLEAGSDSHTLPIPGQLVATPLATERGNRPNVSLATESGQPFALGVPHPQTTEPVELHALDLGDGEQGVGHESVIAEHRVIEPALHPDSVEPRTKTVGDVLRHAARIIEERGWCRESFGPQGGPHCMVGAINVALGERPDHPIPFKLADFLYDHTDPMHGPESWNDTPGRTAAEVIAALRAAADEADR